MFFDFENIKKRLRNFIGWLRQAPTCPNCHDSFLWKEYRTLWYERWGTMSKGLDFCTDCLYERDFDYRKVEASLIRMRWDEDGRTVITSALRALEQIPPGATLLSLGVTVGPDAF